MVSVGPAKARECYDRAVDVMKTVRSKTDELLRFQAEATALLEIKTPNQPEPVQDK
jgi:hypothetical protein